MTATWKVPYPGLLRLWYTLDQDDRFTSSEILHFYFYKSRFFNQTKTENVKICKNLHIENSLLVWKLIYMVDKDILWFSTFKNQPFQHN